MFVNSYKEFEKVVNKKCLSGVFIIYGQERKLIDNSVKLLYDSVQSFPELNIVVLEGENISSDAIVNACETLPFMAEHKIIHIKNPPFLKKTPKDNDDEKKQKKQQGNSDIITYLVDFSDRKIEQIIVMITVDGDCDERSKLTTSVKNNGYVVQFNPLKGEELHKWVQSYFERYGKDISKTDILYLISIAGASTEQLDKEIEKICAYAIEENQIAKKHIDAVVHKNLENNIFKMVDSISKKDADNAILILDTLLAQKEKHLSILGMIIRQYRLLLLAFEYQKLKLSPDSIGEKIKLKGYPLTNLLKQSKNYDKINLKNGLEKCLETDYKIKKGIFSGDELDLSLEMLIVELCK